MRLVHAASVETINIGIVKLETSISKPSNSKPSNSKPSNSSPRRKGQWRTGRS